MKCPSCGYENLPGADACEQCQTSLTHVGLRRGNNDVEHSLMVDPISSLRPNTPHTVALEASLADAIGKMRRHGIGCVLVTDDNGRLAGILTERDLLQKVAIEALDFERCVVSDFMSPAPEDGKPEHPLGHGLHRMIVSDIRYLPLVDEHDRPVGIISSRDIIAFMAERFRAAEER